MKRIAVLSLALAGCVALLTGCASSYPQGVLYTELKLPVSTTSVPQGQKIGTSECRSYLGMIAEGDASIDAAKKNGGISKVSHVDWQVKNILGLYGEYKCTVYGE